VIVISGALVLVALVLLIIGVVSQSLPFVYSSIAVSLVSLVFLVIGILQRRGETVPATGGAASPEAEPSRDADGVTAVIPSQGSRRIRQDEPVAEADPAPAETADEELEAGGTVLVVAGRPRYHVGGCRYLTGKSAEPVDVQDAREEGFTPCGVCKPDESLEQAADVVAELGASEPQDGESVVEEDVPGVEVRPARRAAGGGTRAVTPAKGTPAKASRSSAAKAPSKAAKSAPATSGRKPATAAAAVPVKAVKAPGRAAAKAPSRAAGAAAAAAPAAARRPGSVVVIPDRGKFHTSQCRYVRDVDGAEVLSKSAATRQGYTACGVCKP
jgi:hypothetical protein